MVERLVRNEKVRGSNPLGSTTFKPNESDGFKHSALCGVVAELLHEETASCGLFLEKSGNKWQHQIHRKITIGKRTVRGERMFVVSHKPEGGKRKRSFFKTRTEAETHSEELRLQQKQAGESWMGLDVRERNENMTSINEYKAKGVGLRQALDAFLAQPNFITSKKVVDAYTDFMAEWKRKLVSHRTEMALKSNVGRLVKLHPTKLVSEVERQDVLDYLRPYTDLDRHLRPSPPD